MNQINWQNFEDAKSLMHIKINLIGKLKHLIALGKSAFIKKRIDNLVKNICQISEREKQLSEVDNRN